MHKYAKYATVLLFLALPARAVVLDIDPENLANRLEAIAYIDAIIHRGTDPTSHFFPRNGSSALWPGIYLRLFDDANQVWELGQCRPGHYDGCDPLPLGVTKSFGVAVPVGPHAEGDF